MSDRTLKTLLSVVAALAILYAATLIASGSPGAGAADGDALAAALERAADADEVETIRFPSASDTVELRRGDDGWTVNGVAADTARISALFDALREARIGHLASSNPANHARLGVSDSTARVLEVSRGKGEPVRLLIGEAGPSFSGVYMRLPGEDETYLVIGRIRAHALRSAEDWQDRTVAAADSAAADSTASQEDE